MRVALLCPDLLFGSRLEGALRAAGHDVTRFDDPDGAAAAEADVLVVDLAADEFDGPALAARVAPRVPTVGFYPHVDQELRRRADAAGFGVVVPRSRMAREAAAVVESARRA